MYFDEEQYENMDRVFLVSKNLKPDIRLQKPVRSGLQDFRAEASDKPDSDIGWWDFAKSLFALGFSKSTVALLWDKFTTSKTEEQQALLQQQIDKSFENGYITAKEYAILKGLKPGGFWAENGRIVVYAVCFLIVMLFLVYFINLFRKK